ncbi:MAG: Hsp20/alpha crystallin family protein [Clostridiales bacterium]|nr:Hsp20/alpha crystallin family protein [Clostridiales bacterium]
MLMTNVFGDSFFDDFFNDVAGNDKRGGKKMYSGDVNHMMRTDIRECKDGHHLEIDLPGYKKEDIQISLEKGYLTVKAVRKAESEQKDGEKGRYICRERYVGSCSRSFYVGDVVRQEDIKAEFKDGILKIFVPKMEKHAVEENKFIRIEG